MKNTVISNTFLSLMCDFGGIAPRDNSQHFFTAYVCSRFLPTSTAVRFCRTCDGEINSTALFTAAPYAFRYVLLTTRFQKDYLREGPSCTFPIHKGYCGESVHYTGVSTRMTPEGYMLNLRIIKNRNALGLIAVYPRPDEHRLSLHDIL